MITLNKVNGADKILLEYTQRLTTLDLDKPLIGVVMGSAYGGELEKIGKQWQGKGTLYGYDTFEGHPKHLVEDQNDFEATCMDHWYEEGVYGKEKLSYEYQREELDKQGLDNVILRKGLVNEDSCDDIEYINYAFLDMDIYESMKEGYKAVRDKVLPGFCLFLHDVVPATHIPRLYHLLFDEILEEDGDMWTVIGSWDNSFLACLKRNETR